ncbi:hypothetical protein C5E45_12890 [Nocardia nova]|uniref:ER-bound oxygenase mpaB/mpaB'/Rubber oxygenase catalytic domain-containing protein n=1 Tax=Nocardia nova TaxID=37330 RepID=A0A2S6ARI1_9NOCA|nr:hypothetical protein C5E41_28540 [Nocardia nova]PPJ37806.1 hypothetical protein C5E45_12890 [Nocardia nova]
MPADATVISRSRCAAVRRRRPRAEPCGGPDSLSRPSASNVDVAAAQQPGGPVRYNAVEPQLQLRVAACIYRGVDDSTRFFYGRIDDNLAEKFYREPARFGTTLQMPERPWPHWRSYPFDGYIEEIAAAAGTRKIAGVEVGEGRSAVPVRGIPWLSCLSAYTRQ